MRNILSLSASLIAISSLNGQAFAQADDGDDRIIVTASPLGRTVEETIGGTSVVSKEELRQRLENTIGETLRREPGVSSTFFGQGASRPVIRGLAGPRIRVLDNGIGAIDASVTSPDHAVAIDPATAEQVEIVRGTAMLLYGSSAAGGVVNIVNNRIPQRLPEDGIDGYASIGASTADDGARFNGSFDASVGKLGNGTLVLHGDGFYREGQDYEIPGFAESQALRDAEEAEAAEVGGDFEEEDEAFGILPNSGFETRGASGGLSWVFDDGFFGVSGTVIDSLYGVPGGKEEEEGEEAEGAEEEGGVLIDLRQRRIDMAGEINRDFAIFRQAKVRLGYADYEHIEFEPSGEEGTVFANEGWEGRIDLVTQTTTIAGWETTGAVGGQFQLRDFSAIGEEAFVPPTDTTQYGFFALQEATRGKWRLELGARYESTNQEVVETGVERDFDGFSVSGGVAYEPTDEIFLGVTGFRTERAPATEELFSNGPHLATRAFEIGDPTLDEEIARGVEATARYQTERFMVGVNGFYTNYRDFIYEDLTGEEEDDLPVFQFFAADAEFVGFEVESNAKLYEWSGIDFSLDGQVSYVRATVDTVDGDVPRIPPLQGLIGLSANSEYTDFRAEVELVDDQDDVSAFELPTDGFAFFNVYTSYRPWGSDSPVSLNIAATNLTNDEGRVHASFLKDRAPLLGRNVVFSISGQF
ncbi:MAG: TonB-dependent receptor [Pseudomonadota bacterium]